MVFLVLSGFFTDWIEGQGSLTMATAVLKGMSVPAADFSRPVRLDGGRG